MEIKTKIAVMAILLTVLYSSACRVHFDVSPTDDCNTSCNNNCSSNCSSSNTSSSVDYSTVNPTNSSDYIGSTGSSVGLTFSGNAVVSDTIFKDNPIAHTSTALFMDDKAVIVYSDAVSKKGYYVVVDSNGQLIGCTKKFSDKEVLSTAVVKLSNNNILIAYDINQGKTVVLNPLTGEQKSSSVFTSSKAAKIRVLKLQNGNIVIAYLDITNGNKAAYIICDSNGNTLTNPVVLSDNGYYQHSYINIDLALMSNGNAMIIYANEDGYNYGVYTAIINTNGILIDKKMVEKVHGGLFSIKSMTGGGIVVYYKDITAGSSKSVYYNSISNKFEGPYTRSIYESDYSKQGISLALLPNDFILYCSGFTAYPMDKYGKWTLRTHRITSPDIDYVSAVSFSEGRVLIAFCNIYTNQGKFVILN